MQDAGVVLRGRGGSDGGGRVGCVRGGGVGVRAAGDAAGEAVRGHARVGGGGGPGRHPEDAGPARGVSGGRGSSSGARTAPAGCPGAVGRGRGGCDRRGGARGRSPHARRRAASVAARARSAVQPNTADQRGPRGLTGEAAGAAVAGAGHAGSAASSSERGLLRAKWAGPRRARRGGGGWRAAATPAWGAARRGRGGVGGPGRTRARRGGGRGGGLDLGPGEQVGGEVRAAGDGGIVGRAKGALHPPRTPARPVEADRSADDMGPKMAQSLPASRGLQPWAAAARRASSARATASESFSPALRRGREAS